MVSDKKEDLIYQSDEICNQDADLSWPFASEDEEHLYFDNLQRAEDIRSAR